MTITLNLENAGADIGNFSTEIKMETFNILQPSFIAFKSVVFDNTDENLESSMKGLFDNLKVHIKSDANKINDFYYVGNAAINEANGRAMDISTIRKSESDIPLIMLLSLFAAKRVQEAYNAGSMNESNNGPFQFEQALDLVTAIPASEYKTERAKHLEKRLKGQHEVTLYFGEYQAKVTITIERVKVTEEGKTGMLYLSNLTADDMKDVFADYITKYKKDLIITPETYSLHVDIGNGTTEFTFMRGVNPISSKGINIGIGHAIENAIEVFSSKLDIEIDRQSFNHILQSNSNKATFAKECLAGSLREFSKQILAEIKSAINSLTKGQIDILAIHGGGSIMLESEIKKDLYKLCEEKMSELLYVDKKTAPHLNANGCYELAKIMYKG